MNQYFRYQSLHVFQHVHSLQAFQHVYYPNELLPAWILSNQVVENDLLFKNITVNIKYISAAVIHCYMEVRLLAPLFILSAAVIHCYTEVYFLAPPKTFP